ncbi:hypothetical protein LHL40_004605, partial [Salmonella enterica]|nr:hypothetical protein [Salmonella enterica]
MDRKRFNGLLWVGCGVGLLWWRSSFLALLVALITVVKEKPALWLAFELLLIC